MKAIIYFFIAVFFMSAEEIKADEKSTESSYDYEVMVSDYFETLNAIAEERIGSLTLSPPDV